MCRCARPKQVAPGESSPTARLSESGESSELIRSRLAEIELYRRSPLHAFPFDVSVGNRSEASENF